MAKTGIKRDIDEALQNSNLFGALHRFSEAYIVSREKAYQGLNFEDIREQIAKAKSYAADHMEELAEEFKRNAEARGATVVRLNDPQAANQYIIDLAKKKGLSKVVKSKSMATEEIHMNEALEKEGLKVTETDLGEWIIQLAGQRPSHMVMPAIHMTKEEVASLFSKATGQQLTPDINNLVKVARKELRKAFLEADLGITGANMAIADTGSLVLLTNEGNARLVTTLPKTQVSVVGLEKLIAKIEHAALVMRALPRSATGQTLTSYVTMLTGAAKNIDNTDKDLHIILLDNKRSAMRNDPIFKEALQCIRCASCLNVCPIYRVIGGHVYGKVYAGGIGIILTAWTDGMKSSNDIQAMCIQCGRCKEVCPGLIDIPELILEIRKQLTETEGLPKVQDLIINRILPRKKIFHSALRLGAVAQKPVLEKNKKFIRDLPKPYAALTNFRSFPALADKPFRDRFNEIEQKENLPKKAIFYAGCLIDFIYPSQGTALVKVMNSLGYKVMFPHDQTCCGAPSKYNGARNTSLTLAKDTMGSMLRHEADCIVSACPTCTVVLQKEYLKDFEHDSKWGGKAKLMNQLTVDLCKLFFEEKKEELAKAFQKPSGRKFTYHDSCHLKRTTGVYQESRSILTKLGNMELVEMAEPDMCCGMGGSYSLKFPEISAPILKRKIENIEKTETDLVAIDCPGCIMQIRGGIHKQGKDIKVLHTVEILAELIDEGKLH
ncbi:MAG: LUD domain-containing protein [Bacillota bacterium]|nr:LUD domain-containing protein [Bacillota bacterium]